MRDLQSSICPSIAGTALSASPPSSLLQSCHVPEPDLNRPPIQLIAGPTASGKSALALEQACRVDAMIINADSQQLYADLRILTARPSRQEEALADHRLYGLADASEAWSVGHWCRAVMDLLAQSASQDRPVIIVGGTGLYFSALTRGLAEIPAVPADVRASVETEYREIGETAFRSRLKPFDPGAAGTIERGDRQRLVRAMSVLRHTGRTLSHWQASTQPLLEPGSWKGLVLEPDRVSLYQRCDARADRMMHDEAVDEVKALLGRQLDPNLPAMKAVGVRELGQLLDGKMSFDEALEALKQATRNYAKRQLTWFRNQTSDWERHSG